MFLHAMMDASPNFVFVKNESGRYEFCNQAFAGFFGMTPEEILGKTSADIMGDADVVAEFEAQDLEVFTNGKQIVYPPQNVRHVSGQAHWVQTTKRPVHMESGKGETYLMGVSTDVTDVLGMVDEMTASAHIWNAVADASHQFLNEQELAIAAEKALNAIGPAVRAAAIRIYAHTKQNDGTITALLHDAWQRDENVAHTLSLVAEYAYNGALSELPDRFALSESVIHSVDTQSASARALSDLFGASCMLAVPIVESGQLWGAIVVLYDGERPPARESVRSGMRTFALALGSAVARRKSQRALEEQQAFTQNVLNSLPVEVFVKDQDYRYVMVNKPLADFNGLTMEEMIGRRFDDMTKEVEAARVAYERDTAILAGQGSGNLERGGHDRCQRQRQLVLRPTAWH
jgi:PAS domain S-box-containing protein